MARFLITEELSFCMFQADLSTIRLNSAHSPHWSLQKCPRTFSDLTWINFRLSEEILTLQALLPWSLCLYQLLPPGSCSLWEALGLVTGRAWASWCLSCTVAGAPDCCQLSRLSLVSAAFIQEHCSGPWSKPLRTPSTIKGHDHSQSQDSDFGNNLNDFSDRRLFLLLTFSPTPTKQTNK